MQKFLAVVAPLLLLLAVAAPGACLEDPAELKELSSGIASHSGADMEEYTKMLETEGGATDVNDVVDEVDDDESNLGTVLDDASRESAAKLKGAIEDVDVRAKLNRVLGGASRQRSSAAKLQRVLDGAGGSGGGTKIADVIADARSASKMSDVVDRAGSGAGTKIADVINRAGSAATVTDVVADSSSTAAKLKALLRKSGSSSSLKGAVDADSSSTAAKLKALLRKSGSSSSLKGAVDAASRSSSSSLKGTIDGASRASVSKLEGVLKGAGSAAKLESVIDGATRASSELAGELSMLQEKGREEKQDALQRQVDELNSESAKTAALYFAASQRGAKHSMAHYLEINAAAQGDAVVAAEKAVLGDHSIEDMQRVLQNAIDTDHTNLHHQVTMAARLAEVNGVNAEKEIADVEARMKEALAEVDADEADLKGEDDIEIEGVDSDLLEELDIDLDDLPSLADIAVGVKSLKNNGRLGPVIGHSASGKLSRKLGLRKITVLLQAVRNKIETEHHDYRMSTAERLTIVNASLAHVNETLFNLRADAQHLNTTFEKITNNNRNYEQIYDKMDSLCTALANEITEDQKTIIHATKTTFETAQKLLTAIKTLNVEVTSPEGKKELLKRGLNFDAADKDAAGFAYTTIADCDAAVQHAEALADVMLCADVDLDRVKGSLGGDVLTKEATSAKAQETLADAKEDIDLLRVYVKNVKKELRSRIVDSATKGREEAIKKVQSATKSTTEAVASAEALGSANGADLSLIQPIVATLKKTEGLILKCNTILKNAKSPVDLVPCAYENINGNITAVQSALSSIEGNVAYDELTAKVRKVYIALTAVKTESMRLMRALYDEKKRVELMEPPGTEFNPGRTCRSIWKFMSGLGRPTPDQLYWIKPHSGSPAFRTFCDMDGGGWTLLATLDKSFDTSKLESTSDWGALETHKLEGEADGKPGLPSKEDGMDKVDHPDGPSKTLMYQGPLDSFTELKEELASGTHFVVFENITATQMPKLREQYSWGKRTDATVGYPDLCDRPCCMVFPGGESMFGGCAPPTTCTFSKTKKAMCPKNLIKNGKQSNDEGTLGMAMSVNLPNCYFSQGCKREKAGDTCKPSIGAGSCKGNGLPDGKHWSRIWFR